MHMGAIQNSSYRPVSIRRQLCVAVLSVFLLSSCAIAPRPDDAPSAAAGVPDDQLSSYASAPRLDFSVATLLLDNDTAFEQKLQAVRDARKNLDLAYYIFADDYSSSLLAEELIAAARRGVRVRLLLDYFNNYRRLDLFRFLEREGSKGLGSFEVRFFNRPTENIIADAVYLTLGCGELGIRTDLKACSEKKLLEIGRRLERARSVGEDYDSGSSGLFLSGLYTQSPKIMAYAITEGQQLDLSTFKRDPSLPPKTLEEKEKTLAAGLKAAKVYWQARATNPKGFQKALAKVKLGLAFTFFGDRINPLYDALTAYLPLHRLEQGGPGLRDWDHLTDFLHHKLLLTDGRTLIMGGRNLEDTYHMHNNPLLKRYRFMDTDLRVDVRRPSPELGHAFERLWNFSLMVTGLDQVPAHAPNDFAAATLKADEVCGPVEASTDPVQSEVCRTEAFERYLDIEVRIADAGNSMRQRAERYRREYRPRQSDNRDPSIPVDAEARLYYLENLPFVPDRPRVRTYGAQNGREAESGKAIHAAWLAGLRNTCATAFQERSQRVVLHNAYFIPPSNLLKVMGDMASGTMKCSGVELTAVTNSPGTTDLGIINFAARYPIKAVVDHVAVGRRPGRAARVRYFEYLPQGDIPGKSEVSLHSKVSVLGRDMIIGSANADVRSFMMDTNNGMFIANAAVLRDRYLAWLDRVLKDPNRTVELTGRMRHLTLEEMLQESRDGARALIERKLANRVEGELPLGPALDELESILDNVYELSAKGLGGGPGATDARERYNKKMKLF